VDLALGRRFVAGEEYRHLLSAAERRDSP
jgi:hypothetical protein